MLNPNPHCVSNLTCHLIFVCKYRKPLLEKYGGEIKKLCLECANNSTKFEITEIEVNKDHIHFMINYSTHETIKNIVKQLKSYTTFHIWEKYDSELKTVFWKQMMFWTDSYFACSIGDASRETVRQYIETQGGKPQAIHPRG